MLNHYYMDFNKMRPGLVLLLTGVLAVGISYWGLAYNQGSLQITSPVLPVTISGMYDMPVECDQTLCTYKVKPRVYNLNLSANGYTSTTAAASVKRGKTTKTTYEPLPVPKFTKDQTESTYDDLIYVTTTGQETTLWQRDLISDQQITTLADAEITQIYAETANPIVLIKTDGGTLIEINLLSARKKEVKLPFAKDHFKLLGKKWMTWNEDTQFYYAPFGYTLDNRLSLPIKSSDHIVSKNDQTAYFISQIPLAEANTEANNALVELFNITSDSAEIDASKVDDDQPYLLYRIDLLADKITYLDKLEWTGKDELTLIKSYTRSDLAPVILVKVNKDIYKFEE